MCPVSCKLQNLSIKLFSGSVPEPLVSLPCVFPPQHSAVRPVPSRSDGTHWAALPVYLTTAFFFFFSRIPVAQRLKHEISFKINGAGAVKPATKGTVDNLDLYCFFREQDQFSFFLVSLLSHVKALAQLLRKHGLQLQFNNFATLLQLDLANRVKRHWV